MILKNTILSTVISMAFAGANTFAAEPPCNVPQKSQWNWSEKLLAERTADIVVVKAVKTAHSGKRPEIKPDFELEGGISAHGKSSESASAKSQLDDIWSTTRTTFDVVDSIKGTKKKGSRIDLVTMDIGPSTFEKRLTFPLCDMPLKFERGHLYLIFLNAFNPNGYQEIRSLEDPKLAKIRSLATHK